MGNSKDCGFKVGDTVVCIEENETLLEANDLHFGKKYVVKTIQEDGGSPEWFLVCLQDHAKEDGVFAKRLKKVETQEGLTMGHTAERIREDILHIEKRIEEAKKDIASMEQEKNALIEKLKEKGFEMIGQKPSSTTLEVGDRVVITGYSDMLHTYNYTGYEGTLKQVDDSNRPYEVYLDRTQHTHWFTKNECKKI